jgi:ketosteroid isomerase-like protein
MAELNYKDLALDWIGAWNARDIDKIMDHYADDVEFYSPTVVQRWNIEDGRLIGKAKLKQHFLKGFELAPDLHFEFVSVMAEDNSVTITYKRENGQLVSDYIMLDKAGKAKLVKAYYGNH